MYRFASLDECEIKVMAPVPYFPPLRIHDKWYRFSQVKRKEVIDGFEIYHPRFIITPKLGMSFYGLFMFLSVFQTVYSIQKQYDFDLIDAHFVYPDGFAAVLLGHFFNKPVVISARGTDINLYTKFPLIKKLLSFTLNRGDRIISVCTALKNEIVKLGIDSSKIAVIPNGVDSSKFYPIKKEEARKKLHLPSDKKIILSVGELIPRKGFEVLIEAVHRLKYEYQEINLTFYIAGEGVYRNYLEERIDALGLNEVIDLVGAVDHKDLLWWYNAADIFCLASDREGWPNVIVESLSCGTPVVATNVWGIPEIVTSDNLGILVDRDEMKIAGGILKALHKRWESSHFTEFAENNTWQRVAEMVHQEFSNILSR